MRIHRHNVAVLAAVVTLLTLLSALVFPGAALAWDDCPMGLVNDPYPGACRRYTDTNGDNICDLSQPEPTPATTTTLAPTTTTTTKVVIADAPTITTTTSGEPPTGDCPLGPCIGCGACFTVPVAATINPAGEPDGIQISEIAAAGGAVLATQAASTTTTTLFTGNSADGQASAASSDAAEASSTGSTGTPSLMTRYLVSPIAIGFLVIYGISFILYKTKRMKVATHRKIWNVLLTATFLVTGIFGLILTIQLDYELPFKMPFNLLFWHVEAGVAMTLISLFHMGWHFNYYRNLLRRSRRAARADRVAKHATPAVTPQLVTEAREQRRAEREQRRLKSAERPVTESTRPARPPDPWLKPEAQ